MSGPPDPTGWPRPVRPAITARAAYRLGPLVRRTGPAGGSPRASRRHRGRGAGSPAPHGEARRSCSVAGCRAVRAARHRVQLVAELLAGPRRGPLDRRRRAGRAPRGATGPAEIGPPRGVDPGAVSGKAALLRGWVDAATLGIPDVLLTGDHPCSGDSPDATGVRPGQRPGRVARPDAARAGHTAVRARGGPEAGPADRRGGEPFAPCVRSSSSGAGHPACMYPTTSSGGCAVCLRTGSRRRASRCAWR